MIIQYRRSILQGLTLASFGTTHIVKGVQVRLNEGSCLSPKRDNGKELNFTIFFSSTIVPVTQLGTKPPLVVGFQLFSDEGPLGCDNSEWQFKIPWTEKVYNKLLSYHWNSITLVFWPCCLELFFAVLTQTEKKVLVVRRGLMFLEIVRSYNSF